MLPDQKFMLLFFRRLGLSVDSVPLDDVILVVEYAEGDAGRELPEKREEDFSLEVEFPLEVTSFKDFRERSLRILYGRLFEVLLFGEEGELPPPTPLSLN